MNDYKIGSLVVYHNSPVIIKDILADKITIELKNKKTKKVRSKDIIFLHQGPTLLEKLDENLEGDIESAWEFIEDDKITISDLAELIFEDSTPLAVWKSYQILKEDLYFLGDVENIVRNSKESIDLILSQQREKERVLQEWEDYLKRVKNKTILEEDLTKLKEVEQVIFNQNSNNRTLKAIKIESIPEKAHQFLLDIDLWHETINPYPERYRCNLKNPQFDNIKLIDEERKDLTHLETFAIDSKHTGDPDDAVSLDGEDLWVHIADVASIITPNSEIDNEARGRGSSLYMPEMVVNMLPENIVKELGLGLSEKSVALSFKIKISEEGEPTCEEITPSIIKVKRVTYDEVDKIIDQYPFNKINDILSPFIKKRENNGEIKISLPEIDIHVTEFDIDLFTSSSKLLINSSKNLSTPKIEIKKIGDSLSRKMVADLMIVTGEATANWLIKNKIPAPFATQSFPEEESVKDPKTLAEMIAKLRTLKKSKLSLKPEIHAGLGLKRYTRVTSPLRRYSDLLVHQQIRAFLKNRELISSQEMEEKMTEAEFTASNRKLAGRLSDKHWKLYYVKYLENKEFDAILIIKNYNRGVALIPELNLDVKINSISSLELDTNLKIKITGVNIPKLTAYGKII